MEAQNLFINDFYIYHFKKIKETQFECGPINIFAGANNSGKSSVLTAVHFFYSIWQATITKNNKNKFIIEASGDAKSTKYFKYGTSFTENDLIFLPTVNLEDIAYSELKHTSQSNTKVIKFTANNKSIGLRISHNTNKKSFSLNLTHKNFLSIDKNIQTGAVLSFYSPGLSGISDKEIHYGDQYVRNKAGYSGTAGNILRNILWRIWQDNQKREGFLEDIYAIYNHERDKTILKIVAPSEDFSALQDDGKDNEFLEFKVEIPYDSNDGKTSSKLIPLNQMGAGFLHVMQILAYKHLYQPKVMLLDEPEIHLHGTLIEKLFQILEGWAQGENPTQIFISTHSPKVLNYLLDKDTPEKLYRLFNVQDGDVISTEITKENIEDILTKDLGESFLSPSEIKGLKKEDFKLLLLSEDSDPKINRLISEDLKKEVRVIPGNGADSNSLANRVKNLRENFPDKKILVHVDKDKKQNYKDTKDNIFWFTEHATIEGYFLKNLEGTPCNADKLQYIKKEIKNNSKDGIKHVWNDENFETISKLNTLIEHILLITLKDCEYPSMAPGNAVKKIYGIIKNALKIQDDPGYIDCPSLTRKIKELLGK